MHAAGVDLLQLPRPAQPGAARRRQRAVRAVPHAGKVRCRRASPPCAGQRRRAVRQLPHADEDLHGGGSRGAITASASRGPICPHRSACRTPARMSHRPLRRMGGAGGGRMVSERAADHAALRHSRCTPAGRRRRMRKQQLDRADPGSQPAGDRARLSALLLLARLCVAGVRGRHQGGDRRSGPAGARGGAAGAAGLAVAHRGCRRSRRCCSDPVRAVRIETARALAGVDPQAMTPEQRTALRRRLSGAGRRRNGGRRSAGGASQPRSAGRQAAAAGRCGGGISHRAAARSGVRAGAGEPGRPRPDAWQGRSRAPSCCARRWRSSRTTPPSGTRSDCCWCASTNYAGALEQLRQASELAPDNARYAYVYAIALNSTGAPGRGDGAAGAHPPTASDGPGRAGRPGVDRAGAAAT